MANTAKKTTVTEEVKTEAVTEEVKKPVKEAAAAPAVEKTVRIRLPRTRDDNDDVYVSVNDRTFLIKRGVDVDVPACVAEVLRHHEEMLEKAYEYREANKS